MDSSPGLGTTRRALLSAAAGGAFLTTAACSGANPGPTPTTSVQAAGDGLLPLSIGTREGQNGALRPWWTGSQVMAEIPAGVAAHDKYRSEIFWDRPAAGELHVGEGDRLRCRYTVTPELAGSGTQDGLWQVLWQLHGPLRNGDWPQPPLNLHVRGGSWRVGGGAGRTDGTAAYYEPFQPFVDGARVRWEFDILVSQDRAKARVDAWLDGAHVVRNWHPPSGTRYPDHEFLAVKSGLYTGTDDGSTPPSVKRSVSFAPLEYDVTTQADPTAPTSF